jgi:general secretion pathway protein K
MSRTAIDRDGFALVAVLVFLLVVAAVITPFVLAARTDFQLAMAGYRKDRQTHLAEGLMRLVARQLAASGNDVNEALRLNSQPLRTICGSHQIELRIQDQLSLVDLNGAPLDLLAAGFAAMGFDSGAAVELAQLAEEFRKNGADSSQGGDKLSNGFKSAPFEAIEELYEFPGFTNQPLGKLAEIFTVYGRRETVKANNMSAALSNILPSVPSARFPFIEVSDEAPRMLRIEVSVRSRDGRAAGNSGILIEVTDNVSSLYKELERATDRRIVGGEPGSFVQGLTCQQLFGAEVAAWLTGV